MTSVHLFQHSSSSGPLRIYSSTNTFTIMSDANGLFVLHEGAAGYALFEVVAFEEIGGLLDGAMDTVTDMQRFGRAVKLKAFSPFESAADALENANAVSEHAMTDTLRNFLEMSLPKAKKSSKTASYSLGVMDPALATAIAAGLGEGVSCRSDDTVREIVRGCRLHMDTFVKGLAGGAAEKAQLGLGHSYSRSKVKFNPARSDNMVIQSIALLDQLDKDVNTFAMRVREWYSWHFPELKDLVKDNIMFARAAAFIQDRQSICKPSSGESTSEGENGDDKLAGLTEIVGDEEVAKAVIHAAKHSMGMDCSIVDMINIVNFTQRMVKLAEYRKQLSLYLTDKMTVVAPNLSALIGDSVAARLISKAGSLTNLAKSPASTIQILGAEKALFRALKTKGNTPKYGLIYHSTFIGRAEAKNKGRISRYLANKCAIATRIDSFSDEPSRAYGERLRDQVEERLKFYETGQAPRRNIDVMEEVSRELKAGADVDMDDAEDEPKSAKKKAKKDKKKRKSEVVEDEAEEEEEEEKTPKKSAKKAKKEASDEDEKAAKKSAKKAKKEAEAESPDKSAKKKKKKKSKGE